MGNHKELAVFAFWLALASGGWASGSALQISPPAIVLDNPEATQQVLVRGAEKNIDLTRATKYEVTDPAIAAVNATGLVQPKRQGRTTLVIRHGQQQASVPIEVMGLQAPSGVDFQTQIIPLFSKSGC